MLQNGGGSSLGATLGNLVGTTVKKTTKTSSAGRTASKVGRSVSSGGRSSRSSGGGSSQGYSSSRSSGGGGGSSRSSGGGGGSVLGRAAGTVAKAAPKIPNINSYLGTDSVYQSAVSGGKRSLADFISEIGRRRGEADTQYNMTKGSMERDRETNLKKLMDEYASRGLLQSGLYGEQVGNFEKQYTEQSNALSQQQAALIADLLSQQKNYQRENDLQQQAAKQEALARRAAKYGITG